MIYYKKSRKKSRKNSRKNSRKKSFKNIKKSITDGARRRAIPGLRAIPRPRIQSQNPLLTAKGRQIRYTRHHHRGCLNPNDCRQQCMKRSSRACINKESIYAFNKHCRCEKCVEEKRNFERDIPPNDRLQSVSSAEIPLFIDLPQEVVGGPPPIDYFSPPINPPPIGAEERENRELANFLNGVDFNDPPNMIDIFHPPPIVGYGDGDRRTGTGKHPDIRCHCVGCRKCALEPGPDERCKRNKVHRTNELTDKTEFRDQCKQCSRIPRWDKILARKMTPHPNVTIKRRNRRRRLTPPPPVIRSDDSILDYLI